MSLDLHNRQIKGADFNEETDSLSHAAIDRGIDHHALIPRPRTYPYDTGDVLSVTAGVGANTFGNYVALIPKGTIEFGDTPNRIQILAVSFETFGTNDTFVLEFYESPDGAAFRELGSIRIKRAAALVKTKLVERPCTQLDCDTNGLYARLKSESGNNTVTFSLILERHLHIYHGVTESEETWPFG